MDIFETRRNNLRALMTSRFGGKQVALADAIERSPNYISRCLSTSKASGSSKNIGEELARYIETKLGLDRYQMDLPGAFLKAADGSPAATKPEPAIESSAEHAQTEPAAHARRAALIAALATPRSQEALERIARAANEGRLTEADLILLEQIASRFESGAGAGTEQDPPKNGNQRLKERLRNNDPGTQR